MATTITGYESEQIEKANATGRTPVVFIHGLWLLPSSWELAARGSHGAHRFPLAGLTVAVAAQHAGIDILHFDRHLERLGDHLNIGSRWISDPS